MFACIVAGRPAQQAAQVSDDRFVFQVQDAGNINHLVVFTATPFPDPNYGAAVYYNPPNRPDQWYFLGILTNDKPSAIYRLRGAVETSQQSLPAMAGFQTTTDVATIGLLIQDLQSLQASASNSMVLRSTQASAPVSPTQLANLTGKNLFNYLSSFAQQQQDQVTGKVMGNFVDISLIENWLRNFENKTKATGGTAWLENQSD